MSKTNEFKLLSCVVAIEINGHPPKNNSDDNM